MTTIALLDLSAIYWTAYHANGSDQPADMPARATVERVREYAGRFDHLAVCCDSGKSWRKEIASDYKANREAKPEEARAQLDRAMRHLEADGFVMWRADGFEADDVIASAVKALPDHDVVVITADKDLMQLVSDGPSRSVKVESIRWDAAYQVPGRDKPGGSPVYDEAMVMAKFGVRPDQIPAYLAIMGDASDNIPGVPKCGKVTAAKLLKQYDDVLGVIDAAKAGAPDVGEKMAAAIVEHQQAIAIGMRLTLLRDDVSGIDWQAVLSAREEKPLPKIESGEQGGGGKAVADADFEDVPPQAPAEAKPAAPSAIVVYEPGTDAWAMALEPRTPSEAKALARIIFDSRLFASNFGSPEAAMVAVIRGRELGIPAIASLQLQHNIKGKLTMAWQLIVGLVHKSPFCDYIKPVEVSGTRATWKGHRKGDPDPDPTIVTYTIEQARAAGFLNQRADSKGDSGWIRNPDDMLSKTAAVKLARRLWPDIVGGLYMPEELGDE